MAKLIETWFKFDSPEDEEPSHVAEIREDRDALTVEWWNESVGQVTSREFFTLNGAHEWLAEGGYTLA